MTLQFRILISAEIKLEMSHLSPIPKRQIREGLRQLEWDPGAGKPLEDELAGYWSLAIGSYRVVYRVEDRSVRIRAIGHRQEVYELVTAAARAITANEPRQRWRRILPKRT